MEVKDKDVLKKFVVKWWPAWRQGRHIPDSRASSQEDATGYALDQYHLG